MDDSNSGDPKEERLARVVEARTRLRERYFERMRNSPSVSDPRPQGSGPTNRHGMPRLPVGQHETQKWPVLDLGLHPTVEKRQWKLTVDGAVRRPFALGWEDFMALDQIEEHTDDIEVLDQILEQVKLVGESNRRISEDELRDIVAWCKS